MTNRLFVCGDTHGSVDIKKLNSKNFTEQKELTRDDVLIQLGDFGLIWYPSGKNKEQDHWLEWLSEKNFTTAVVLGNHENYNIIESLPWEHKWDNEVQYWLAPNGNKIYFFKRGGIYNIGGRKILTIGGAKSSDIEYRTISIDWWEQEELSYAEIEACFCELDEKGYTVDYILSHTCPQSLVGEFIHQTKHTEGKFKCSVAKFLDEIDNRVEFKEWHFGHMHMDFKYEDDDGVYQCHYNNAPMELE